MKQAIRRLAVLLYVATAVVACWVSCQITERIHMRFHEHMEAQDRAPTSTEEGRERD